MHQDFGQGGIKDADNEPLPPEVFHYFKLENQISFAVRASGTEPKLKYYVFAHKDIDNTSELSSVKSEVSEIIQSICKRIHIDLKDREN